MLAWAASHRVRLHYIAPGSRRRTLSSKASTSATCGRTSEKERWCEDLIVGAGIAGLSFARALANTSIRVDIVESASELRAIGAGILIQPNGMAALEKLGLAEQVLRAGSVLSYIRHHRNDSEMRLLLAAVWDGAACPTVGVRRSDLQAILLGGIRNADNVQLRLGTAAAEFTSSKAGVAASFVDGRTALYDLVVGADGADSSVRRQLLPGSDAEATGFQWWRIMAVRPAEMSSTEWLAGEHHAGSFGIYPIGRDLVHSHVLLSGQTSRSQAGKEATFLEETVASWHPLIADVIRTRITQPHVGTPKMVRPPVWGRGRIVLIGDAAHAISPTLSQGGSLAMEDACWLAALLRDGWPPDTILEQFAGLRNAVVSWALKMAKAQVVNANRGSSSRPVAEQDFALRYMQRMYSPLVEQSARLMNLALA